MYFHFLSRLPYGNYFGGVSALSRQDFEAINGFSNKYFGWGGEDDDIEYRYLCMRCQFLFKIGNHIIIDKTITASIWKKFKC